MEPYVRTSCTATAQINVKYTEIPVAIQAKSKSARRRSIFGCGSRHENRKNLVPRYSFVIIESSNWQYEKRSITMKAVICTKYGPPDVLQIRDVETPVPGENEVLIKIQATTCHIGDTKIRGFRDIPFWQKIPLRLFLGITKPRKAILGMELSGEVEEVGKKVQRFKAGDRIFALSGFSFGAYAEYICMSEDGMLAKMPANMAFEEAAPVPGGGITALVVLRKAKIKIGQKVLIYGASGSVGTYAVQLARSFGAEVTGVCSTANLDLIRSIGADRVIDYTIDDFVLECTEYDVIFDAVDKISPARAKLALKKTGIYLNVNSDSGNGKDLKAQDLYFLKELIEAEKITTVIDRMYPLEQMIEAHRYVEKGHKKGNVVITVGSKK